MTLDELQQGLAGWQPLIEVMVIAFSAVILRLALRFVSRRLVRSVTKSVKTARSKNAAEQQVAEARTLQRTRTTAAVIDNSGSWLIGVTAVVMSLSSLGVDIGALIAVTTVVGAAIGFGAQNAVRDYIAGIFIVIEDQYGVGDWIDLDGVSGEVEKVGLRVTQLRDSQGTLWFIRNGEVAKVGNSSQEWAKALIEVGFSNQTELAVAEKLVVSAAKNLRQHELYKKLILEDATVAGVEQIGSDRFLLRVSIKTSPKKQWQVGNAFRAELMTISRKAGIDILEAIRPSRGSH